MNKDTTLLPKYLIKDIYFSAVESSMSREEAERYFSEFVLYLQHDISDWVEENVKTFLEWKGLTSPVRKKEP